ncbi:hypothetical protein [Acetobacter conturbans]|uniref:DUF2336 domain-containing protein n=1 Tax=Acetobacter conturbans TaxID=1737472 RepID=A0ABX0JXG7_9PROT|nr:hypothetical protein [Acetobacter conturbans]NHN87986.1 hypothetical protein [Acetobacter conturbans]
MNASLDPKFFQILPTRSLSAAPAASTVNPLLEKGRIASPATRKNPVVWECLRERIASLRPDVDAQKITLLTGAVQKTLDTLMNDSWQRARRVIAQVTGEAQAISIIGPLSESASVPERLMAEIDDETLSHELQKRANGVKLTPPKMAGQHAMLVSSVAGKSLAQIEPVLDEMEKAPDRPTALEYACVTVTKMLVRERCVNLVAPVKQKIEKELSFELAATSELVKPRVQSEPATTVINDNIADLATEALYDDNVDAIVELLARAPNFAADVVRETLNGRNARAITALAWKAGLPASVSAAIQIHLALIPPTRAILPALDGSYALSPRELNWQLDFLREKATALIA